MYLNSSVRQRHDSCVIEITISNDSLSLFNSAAVPNRRLLFDRLMQSEVASRESRNGRRRFGRVCNIRTA